MATQSHFPIRNRNRRFLSVKLPKYVPVTQPRPRGSHTAPGAALGSRLRIQLGKDGRITAQSFRDAEAPLPQQAKDPGGKCLIKSLLCLQCWALSLLQDTRSKGIPDPREPDLIQVQLSTL